ncbi:uncharacterized protein LOC108268746 [Ictalurus punctatus]|uniref:Uncharacterized protein LOC108268746 n=1 Tax=Ictalurus punctatus TaxID=7998 RepID=A0A2D0RFQ6_ICTPU|nr:uncharacterized protein LOC108268746 [Ictalurus punctatus]
MTVVWILVSSLCIISAPAQSLDLSRPSFISVRSGECVTLNCTLIGSSLDLVIWYKQIFGEMPQKVGEGLAYKDVKISPEFKTSGYKMETTDSGISLTISHIKKEHGGLYYCGQLSWENVAVNLSRGTFLDVTDERDISVSVFQSGVSDSVPAGVSVTLQCSVLSESRSAELQVLWFRAAPPQSHPQIIYTHHNSSHQCESGSSTHTCVYNFSKNILSLSDTGTYYCAVSVCGKIIFGNGTQVQLKSVDPAVICLAVALVVCVVVISIQALLFCKWRTHEQHTNKQNTKRRPKKTSTQDRDSVELNYAALHFKEKKTKTGREKRKQPQDSVYSEVRSLTTT